MYLVKDKMHLIFDTKDNNILLKLEIEDNNKEVVLLDFNRVEVNYNDEEFDNLNLFLNENYEIESDIREEDFVSDFEGIQYSEEKNISFITNISLKEEAISNYINEDLKPDFETFLNELNKSLILEKNEKEQND